MQLHLRPVRDTDLDAFYLNQLDPQANHMAAFTAANPSDRAAFDAHWRRIIADESITIRTIVVDDSVAGHVLSYLENGQPEISYWLGCEFWGRGIATRSLHMFLEMMTVRPVFARVVSDNTGSLRVLQKCGFVQYGSARGFANARGAEVAEALLRLD